MRIIVGLALIVVGTTAGVQLLSKSPPPHPSLAEIGAALFSVAICALAVGAGLDLLRKPRGNDFESKRFHQAPAVLYGRAVELRAVHDAPPNRLVVIAGNPGSGKSELLRKAAATSETLAPLPTPLMRHSGALQVALLQQLAMSVELQAGSFGTLARAGEILGRAAERVASQRLKDLAAASAHFVAGVLKDRLGDTVGDLAADVWREVSTRPSEQLNARIRTLADDDVLAAVLGLAEEVQRWVGRELTLSLDQGERLSEEDLRLLLDVSDSLPAGIRLHMAAATPSIEAVERIERVRLAGATVVELSPLDRHSVAAWLASEGVFEGKLDEIMRVTGGVPLFVNAAIGHLLAGEALGSLPSGNEFEGQMRWCFDHLPPNLQQVCLRLSIFEDAPALDVVLDVLGCSETEFLIAERGLVDARIFVVAVGERRWFHELGRRAIWNEVLTPAERRASASIAGPVVEKRLSPSGGDLSLNTTFARACLSNDTLAMDLGVQRMCGLPVPRLSILAALVELLEPDHGPRVFEGSTVLDHAREAFGIDQDIDLVVELEALADEALVHLEVRDNLSFVAPQSISLQEFAVMSGRAVTELRRPAIPALATAIFRAQIAPAVAGFVVAQFGLGSPDLETLSLNLRRLESLPSEDGIVGAEPRPGVVVKARVGFVDAYAVANFKEVETRDVALSRLAGASGHVAGEPVQVLAALGWPLLSPRPSMRIVNGAKRITGLAHGGPWKAKARDLDVPPSASIGLERQVEFYCLMRRLMPDTDLSILDLLDVRGYVHCDDGDRAAFVAEVVGLTEARAVPFPDPVRFGFVALDLARLAELEPHQRVRSLTYQMGQPSVPTVADSVAEVEAKLHAFNRAQGYGLRHSVAYDPGALESALLEASRQASADAVALAESGLFAVPDDFTPFRKTLIAITPERPNPSWVPGATGRAVCGQVPAATEDSVELIWREPMSREDENEVGLSPEQTAELFGIGLDELLSGGGLSMSNVLHAIAPLLGFRDESLRLVHQGER